MPAIYFSQGFVQQGLGTEFYYLSGLCAGHYTLSTIYEHLCGLLNLSANFIIKFSSCNGEGLALNSINATDNLSLQQVCRPRRKHYL